MNADYYADKRG